MTQDSLPSCVFVSPARAKPANVAMGPDKRNLKAFRFGLPLDRLPCTYLPDCGNVPTFLVEAGEILWKHADVEGLFGKSGDLGQHNALKTKIEQGERLGGLDVHEVAHLVKTFLRLLPDPLVPTLFHDPLISSMDLQPARRAEAVQNLCFALPASNLSCLRYFLRLLNHIASRDGQNRMNPRNLAVVLTPSIIRLKSRTKLMSREELRALPIQTALMEHLIRHADAIGAMTSKVRRHSMEMVEKVLRKKIYKRDKKKKDKAYADSRVEAARAALRIVADLHFRPHVCDSVPDAYLVDGPHIPLPGSASLAPPTPTPTADKPRTADKPTKRAHSASVAITSGSRRRGRGRSQSIKRREKARRRKAGRAVAAAAANSLMKVPLLGAWSNAIPVRVDSEEDWSSSQDSDWSDEESSDSEDDEEEGARKSSRGCSRDGKPMPKTTPTSARGDPAGSGETPPATGENCAPSQCNNSCPASAAGRTAAVSRAGGFRKEMASKLPVPITNSQVSARRSTLSDPIHNPRKLLNDRGTAAVPPSLCGDRKTSVMPRRPCIVVNPGPVNNHSPPKASGLMLTIHGQVHTAISERGKTLTGSLSDSSINASMNTDKCEQEVSDCFGSTGDLRVDLKEPVKSARHEEIPHNEENTEIALTNECKESNQNDTVGRLDTLTEVPTDCADSPPEGSFDEIRSQANTDQTNAPIVAGVTDVENAPKNSFVEKVLSQCITQHFALNSSTTPRAAVRTQPAGKLKKRLLLSANSEREQHAQRTCRVDLATPPQPVQEAPQTDLPDLQASAPNAGGTGPEDTAAPCQRPPEHDTKQQETNNQDSYPPPVSNYRNRQRRLTCGIEIFPPHQRFQLQPESEQQQRQLSGWTNDHVLDPSIHRMSYGMEIIPPHILQHLENERLMTSMNSASGNKPKYSTARRFCSDFLPCSNRQRRMSYAFEKMPPYFGQGHRLLEENELGTNYSTNQYNIFETGYCMSGPSRQLGPIGMQRLPNNMPHQLENKIVDNSRQPFGMTRLHDNPTLCLELEVHDDSQQMLPSCITQPLECLPQPRHLQGEVLDKRQQSLQRGIEEPSARFSDLQNKHHVPNFRRQRRLTSPRRFSQLLQADRPFPYQNRQRRLSCGMPSFTFQTESVNTTELHQFRNRQRRQTQGIERLTLRRWHGEHDGNKVPRRELFQTERWPQQNPDQYSNETYPRPSLSRRLDPGFQSLSCDNGRLVNYSVSEDEAIGHVISKQRVDRGPMPSSETASYSQPPPALPVFHNNLTGQGYQWSEGTSFKNQGSLFAESGGGAHYDGIQYHGNSENIQYAAHVQTRPGMNDMWGHEGDLLSPEYLWNQAVHPKHQAAPGLEAAWNERHCQDKLDGGFGSHWENQSRYGVRYPDRNDSDHGNTWMQSDDRDTFDVNRGRTINDSASFGENMSLGKPIEMYLPSSASGETQNLPCGYQTSTRLQFGSSNHQRKGDSIYFHSDQTSLRPGQPIVTGASQHTRIIQDPPPEQEQILQLPKSTRSHNFTQARRGGPPNQSSVVCPVKEFASEEVSRSAIETKDCWENSSDWYPAQCDNKYTRHEFEESRVSAGSADEAKADVYRSTDSAEHTINDVHLTPNNRPSCENADNGNWYVGNDGWNQIKDGAKHISQQPDTMFTETQIQRREQLTKQSLKPDGAGKENRNWPLKEEAEDEHELSEGNSKTLSEESIQGERSPAEASFCLPWNENVYILTQEGNERDQYLFQPSKESQYTHQDRGVSNQNSDDSEEDEKKAWNLNQPVDWYSGLHVQNRLLSNEKQSLSWNVENAQNPSKAEKEDTAKLTKRPEMTSGRLLQLSGDDMHDADIPENCDEKPARTAESKEQVLKLVDEKGIPLDPRMVGVRAVNRKHRRTSPICRVRKVDCPAAETKHGAWDDLDLDALQQHSRPQRTVFLDCNSAYQQQHQQQQQQQQRHDKLDHQTSFPEGGDVAGGRTTP